MPRSRPTFTRAAQAGPPQAWFGVSAVFHYLGPSFAVLLALMPAMATLMGAVVPRRNGGLQN